VPPATYLFHPAGYISFALNINYKNTCVSLGLESSFSRVNLLHNLQPHARLSLLSDQWGQCLDASNSSLDTLTAAAVAVAAIGTCAGSSVQRAQSISTLNQFRTSITQRDHLNTPPVVSDSSDTLTDSSLETTVNNGPQSIVVEGEAPETGNALHFWEGTISNQQLPLARRGSVGGGPLDADGIQWETVGGGPLDVDGIEWETVGGGPLDVEGIEWEPATWVT